MHWLWSSPFLGENPRAYTEHTWGAQSTAGVPCLPGCSLSLPCVRVAWLHNLNRLVSCKLFSSFSTLVKEFHQVGEEIPGKQTLGKMPETHLTLVEGWRSQCDLTGKVNFIPVPKFCLILWTDNFIKDSTNFFMAFLLFWQICFFKYFGLPTQMKAFLHTPL